MGNNHIIHNLKFDIKGFKNNSEYHHFANRISAIIRSSLTSKMNRLFDKYAADGYHIIIKSIELDLGYINTRNLENNILVKIDKFLERHLINIKTKVDYQIKQELSGYKGMIDHNQAQFDLYKKVFNQHTSSKEGANNFSSSITGEIIDIIPEKVYSNDLLVLPDEAKYHEAILHFLEYGWLPRHLNIPESDFQQIFSDYILENHDYVLKYFGRKPQRKKALVIERLEKQISLLPNTISQKTKKRNQLKSLNREISKEKFRIIAKSVQALPKSKLVLSKAEKKIIKEIFNDQFLKYTELNKLSELIYKVEKNSKISVQKELFAINSELEKIISNSNLSKEKKQKLKELKEKANQDYDQTEDESTFIPFPPSAKELFDEQIQILLDSKDKTAFLKLLDTKFYKSITKSYTSSNDSVEHIARAFISLILNPEDKKVIFLSLPDHIQTEKEIINQLYKKSPVLVVESLKTLIKLEGSSQILQEKIISFLSHLNKSHIVLIMKSMLSNYTKIAPILSFINYQESIQVSTPYREIDKNRLSETIIIKTYLSSSEPIVSIVNEYIETNLKSITVKNNKSDLKNIQQRIKKELPLISERSFSPNELTFSWGIKQLIGEQERTIESKVIDQFKILIQDFYIPTNNKNLAPKTISQLIDSIKKTYNLEFSSSSSDHFNDIVDSKSKELAEEIQKKNQVLDSKDADPHSDQEKPFDAELTTRLGSDTKDELNELSRTSGDEVGDVNTLENKSDSESNLQLKNETEREEILRQEKLNPKEPNITSPETQESESDTISKQIEDLKENLESNKSLEKDIKVLKQNKNKNVELKVLSEIFDSKKVLKNKILRQLSRKEFSDLLEIVLPVNSFRTFISLFKKYHFLWKTGIDEKQVQVIFISLVKNHKHVDSRTIFKFFFDQLKEYKAWTNEILKRKVIERYEKHISYLFTNEKQVVIEYINQIDTLDGVALKDTRMKLEQGIPVKNAGLVLLWPFFKTLFQLTDLIDDNGEFRNKEARERGTLLLQYIAVKSSRVVESYLALNKILTGFPLEDTMASEIVLTEKEIDISEALLKNVIKQWSAISTSSVENLRGAFIIRDGILSFRNNQWILKVETKAYDLLLGKLPWGFSMIRLSWIPYMIKVEWN